MEDIVFVMKKEIEGYRATKTLLTRLELQIKQIEHELENVKSVSWDKVGRKESTDYNEQKRLYMIEKKEQLEKNATYYRLKVEMVEDFLKLLEPKDKKLVLEKYWQRKPYGFLAREYDTTEWQIRQKIDAIIEVYLK